MPSGAGILFFIVHLLLRRGISFNIHRIRFLSLLVNPFVSKYSSFFKNSLNQIQYLVSLSRIVLYSPAYFL